MTDRERLIELLKVCLNYENIETDDGYVGFDVRYENIADYLLANGVIVPPCKVGDKVYFIYDDCEFPVGCHTKRKCKGCEYRNLHIERQIMHTEASVVMYKDYFGKTVFLTKEEAERELEKRGKENA